MMKCDQTIEQLSAFVDGQLDMSQMNAIEAHVRECSVCRATAEELRQLDSQLGQSFQQDRMASQQLAQRVINLLPVHGAARPQPRSRTWVPLLLAAAAGFVLACCLLPLVSSQGIPQLTTGQNTSSSLDERDELRFATVGVATGPIEVAALDADAAFADPDIPVVTVGTKMRTGPFRKCELITEDGAMIRLNGDTEILVSGAREIVLESGRLWCQVMHDSPSLAVKSNGATVSVSQATCDLRCEDEQAELVTIDGSIGVVGGDWDKILPSGKKLTFTSNAIVAESDAGNLVMETRWIHDLLLRKEGDSTELRSRVEQLLADLGYGKLNHLYEDELRSMGEGCVSPLAAFLSSNDSRHADERLRELAAKILADVARYQSSPILVELLEDANPQVRYHAARGLKRITGREMGSTADQWRARSLIGCGPAKIPWQKWLADQPDRFPSQPVPQQATPPLMQKAALPRD